MPGEQIEPMETPELTFSQHLPQHATHWQVASLIIMGLRAADAWTTNRAEKGDPLFCLMTQEYEDI